MIGWILAVILAVGMLVAGPPPVQIMAIGLILEVVVFAIVEKGFDP